LEKYEHSYDAEELTLMLQGLDPRLGLGHFLGCGKITDLSDLIHKADPLEVPEQVLWMVTLSCEWQGSVGRLGTSQSHC
jgi:hypothetical protein